MTVDIYQALAEVEKNNESAALCTVVKSIGSTPRHVGSKMLVYPDGKFIGTVVDESEKHFDPKVVEVFLQLLREGKI